MSELWKMRLELKFPEVGVSQGAHDNSGIFMASCMPLCLSESRGLIHDFGILLCQVTEESGF